MFFIQIKENDQNNKVTTETKNTQDENVNKNTIQQQVHPAPLPIIDISAQVALNKSAKEIPPRPDLTVESEKRQYGTAVVLTWEVPGYDTNTHEKIKEYELYGYRENDTDTETSDAWRLVS